MKHPLGRLFAISGLVIGAGAAFAGLAVATNVFDPMFHQSRAEAQTSDRMETGSLALASIGDGVDTAAGRITRGTSTELGQFSVSAGSPLAGETSAERNPGAVSAKFDGGGRTVAAAFDMSHVERVRLRVWGAPELGGDYAIEADATLSLPGLGRIGVAGLGAADLENELSKRLAFLMRRDVTVSVEIAQFRPFFIMGQISGPGATPWRPSLNVVQAIALSGGILRAGDGADTQNLMRQQARSQLRFALAQLARLKAEQEGVDQVVLNERIASLIDGSPTNQKAQLQAFISRQNAMLAEQRALFQAQLDGLSRDKEAASAELSAAETQARSIRTQWEISRGLLADLQGLKDKQLVANSRYLQQRTDAITAEVRLAEAQNLSDRARARVESIDRQIVRVQQERRVTLSERITTLEQEIAQLEVSLAETGIASDEPFTLTYQIARQTGEEMKTIAATLFTEVLPGDVVIVSGGNSGARLAASGSPAVRHADASAREHLQQALEASAATARRASVREASRGAAQMATR